MDLRTGLTGLLVVGLLLVGMSMLTHARGNYSAQGLPQLIPHATGLVSFPFMTSFSGIESNIPGSSSNANSSNAGSKNNGEPGRPVVDGKRVFNGVEHLDAGADATKMHVTTGKDASHDTIPEKYKGPVSVHIDNPGFPDDTTDDRLVHVADGPDKTRLVFDKSSIHGSEPGPDQTRYFPTGWHHNDIPGPMQTLYVGPGWDHWTFSSYMGPPGSGNHIDYGPDATKNKPLNPPWAHIDNAPDGSGQNSQYVASAGPNSGLHIDYGPDQTLWKPSNHHASGADESAWSPDGWVHVTTPGPQQTSWHPPGWDHQDTGPKATQYMPPGFFHAMLSPPGYGGDPMGGVSSDATEYLPPGWEHKNNADSPDNTLYLPADWTHAAIPGGGQWPAPGLGLWHSWTSNFSTTSYIPSSVSHDSRPDSADETRYTPTGGTFHGTVGIDASHYLPESWKHVGAGSTDQGGMPIDPTRYVEPDWHHNESGESPSQYTTAT